MKRAVVFILAAAMLFLCACNGGKTVDSQSTTLANATLTAQDTSKTSQKESTSSTTAENLTTTVTTAVTTLTTVVTTAPRVSSTIKLNEGETYTGYDPLPTITFDVTDPDNTRGLPTERINHSYGVAKNGQAHEISVNAQKFFATKGYKAFCLDTKSAEKTLYLTFDCGWENGYTAVVLDTLKEKNVPAAFFCTLDHIKSQPALIARMITEGHIIGNHSNKHPNFAEISRTRMAQEILDCDNYLRQYFGYTSPFFRFPEGSYNESALELVGSMGFKSAFWSCAYADWDVNNPKGKDYAFDTVTARLHPGAVILLHCVSPDNALALGDIIDWAREQGYVFKSLEEFPV